MFGPSLIDRDSYQGMVENACGTYHDEKIRPIVKSGPMRNFYAPANVKRIEYEAISGMANVSMIFAT